jgi:hypothetical protein
VVSGSPGLSTTATTPSAVGSYPITVTAGTLTAMNYAFPNLVDGTLTVNVVSASLSFGDLVFTYDGSAHLASVMTDPAGLPGVTVTYTLNNMALPSPIAAGSYSVVATLDNPNATAADVTGTLVIKPATPAITWNSPADIVYGTPLGAGQLDAAAAIAGSFTYSPVPGTFLNAGLGQTLTATFTPADSRDYDAVAASTQINVTPAPLMVTADDASMTAGQGLPSFAAHYSGFVRGEGPGALGGSLTFQVPPGAAGQAGQYAITPGGLNSSNYTITYINGTLTVAPRPIPLVTVQSALWQTEKLSHNKTAKVLVVSYSGALNGGDAQDLAAYHLVAVGTGKKSAKAQKTVPLTSATYNTGAHNVTLTTRGAVPNQALQLDINPTLVLDADGRPISGEVMLNLGKRGITLMSTSLAGSSSRPRRRP